MLVIDPTECIDCGVCEYECPVKAIESDIKPGLDDWAELNAKYAALWPRLTRRRDPLPEAEKFDGVPDKLNKYFSDKPGEGD